MRYVLRVSLLAAFIASLTVSPIVSLAADADGTTGAGGTSGAGVGPDKGQGLPSTSRSTPGSPALGAHGTDPAHPATKSADAVTGDTRLPAGTGGTDPGSATHPMH
jgi:hypothetical protein